jgi:hypothetical protein
MSDRDWPTPRSCNCARLPIEHAWTADCHRPTETAETQDERHARVVSETFNANRDL